MNVLIIGSGGREHSIACAIKKSKNVNKIIIVPGNPGMEQVGECVAINIKSLADVLYVCKNYNIDLIIIGPEQPIADGLADELRSYGYNVFAPSKFAAQLESSKVFAKQFMEKYNIPTAKYAIFNKTELNQSINYINNVDTKIVLKADGLAAGKGVIVTDSKDYAIKSISELFQGKFGEAGNKVIIEEFMEGEESSILAICDGENFICLPPAQDHKRIAKGDTGANTGGMGAYCPVSIVNKEILDKIKNEIIVPTLSGMRAEGNVYIGCLYVGLMIKDGVPKVVEYNCRFGDPETQAILSIFEGDFATLLYSAANRNIEFNAYDEKATLEKTACCVVLASEGYPNEYKTGFYIQGLHQVDKEDVILYHSGTKKEGSNILTNGGRVLGVTAVGKNIIDTVKKVYGNVEKIKFDNIYYRTDIAKKEIERLQNK